MDLEIAERIKMGVSDWLRGRVLRWLAHGGEGVTLGIQGAYCVSIEAAGQVTVTGGRVVAKGCQIVQDSTGEKILAEPERVDCTDMRVELVTNPTNERKDRIRRNSKQKALAWNSHNLGSGDDD